MINIQLDLGKPQPLLIETNTSNFKYPCDRDGNILFNEKEQMELFCSNGFAAPGVKANSIIVSCETGNKFSINGICYSFNEFICNNIPFHVARRTENRCFGNSTEVQIGFEVGQRFLKVFDVCYDDVLEQTYYSR